MEFIAKISDEHKTATHNVWAYQIGEQDQWQRYSDDGEPSGTGSSHPGSVEANGLEKYRCCRHPVIRGYSPGGQRFGAGLQ